MKKIILSIVSVIAINTLSAQVDTPVAADINGVDPPATVVTKFKADHPNIDPLWGMEDDNFSAGYRDQMTNTEKIVVYDRYGNIVQINNEMTKTTYPKAISDYFDKNYPDEKNYKIWSTEDAKGNKTYYSKHKTGTLKFDKNGNYILTRPYKSKKETPKKNTSPK